MKNFRRALCLLLSALMLFSLPTGCGKTSSDDETLPEAIVPSEPLTAQDNDTMQLNLLFSLIGTPDSGVTELLGEGDADYSEGRLDSRRFDGIVYGQEVLFSANYDAYECVDSIYVDFPEGITSDQITDAITELTGSEPDDEGLWYMDSVAVSISEVAGGIRILLEAPQLEN